MSDVINRRAAGLTKKMFETFERLGIDLVSVPASPREAVRIVERNIDVLRLIEQTMRQQGPTTAPTPERVAHAVVPPRQVEVTPGQPKAHRFDWALDSVRGLNGRQYQAADRLRRAYEVAQPASRVADPTAVGGASDPSKRLAISEKQEVAARQVAWIMRHADRVFKSCIRNFVLEQKRDGAERCLNVAEWGAKTTGHAGDKAMRAAGAAAIILACAHLANLWDDYDQEQREQCSKTDRMMRSDIGRRAARQGWIVALWTWCHRRGRLPSVQGEVDECRAIHDTDAGRLRQAPPIERDRWQRRTDRLTAIAYRDEDERRVRIA